ncbi:hypothetical protein E3P84_00965 [Wallemia ichthyophaga]|nr:hypothetical protein E3P84_00965 [Wallemia ichthyophaga]TIB42753.1 hypothetical protein E3P83_01010 [Wallemia ichthyophaga]
MSRPWPHLPVKLEAKEEPVESAVVEENVNAGQNTGTDCELWPQNSTQSTKQAIEQKLRERMVKENKLISHTLRRPDGIAVDWRYKQMAFGDGGVIDLSGGDSGEEQSIEQPIEQTVEQPTEQSTEQSTDQPHTHTPTQLSPHQVHQVTQAIKYAQLPNLSTSNDDHVYNNPNHSVIGPENTSNTASTSFPTSPTYPSNPANFRHSTFQSGELDRSSSSNNTNYRNNSNNSPQQNHTPFLPQRPELPIHTRRAAKPIKVPTNPTPRANSYAGNGNTKTNRNTHPAPAEPAALAHRQPYTALPPIAPKGLTINRQPRSPSPPLPNETPSKQYELHMMDKSRRENNHLHSFRSDRQKESLDRTHDQRKRMQDRVCEKDREKDKEKDKERYRLIYRDREREIERERERDREKRDKDRHLELKRVKEREESTLRKEAELDRLQAEMRKRMQEREEEDKKRREEDKKQQEENRKREEEEKSLLERVKNDAIKAATAAPVTTATTTVPTTKPKSAPERMPERVPEREHSLSASSDADSELNTSSIEEYNRIDLSQLEKIPTNQPQLVVHLGKIAGIMNSLSTMKIPLPPTFYDTVRRVGVIDSHTEKAWRELVYGSKEEYESIDFNQLEQIPRDKAQLVTRLAKIAGHIDYLGHMQPPYPDDLTDTVRRVGVIDSHTEKALRDCGVARRSTSRGDSRRSTSVVPIPSVSKSSKSKKRTSDERERKKERKKEKEKDREREEREEKEKEKDDKDKEDIQPPPKKKKRKSESDRASSSSRKNKGYGLEAMSQQSKDKDKEKTRQATPEELDINALNKGISGKAQGEINEDGDDCLRPLIDKKRRR